MTSCPCISARATTIAFGGGLDLRRCQGCERNTWLLDGRELSFDAAGSELRGRFHRLRVAPTTVLRRGRRPAANSAADLAARRQARAYAARELAETPARRGEISAALASGAVGALLTAQGLPGTWKVLGASSA